METKKKKFQEEDENIVNQVLFWVIPYWPLFLVLLIISGAGSLLYLRYATPLYEASATVLIKDEKKGSSDSRIMESLNIFTSNDIVENEMEVLQSQDLMKEVAVKLNLYAPIFMEGRIKSVSAYTLCPVKVEVKNPMDLDTLTGTKKIYFTYNSTHHSINIGKKKYAIDEWINLPYCTLKFYYNPNYKPSETKSFYLTLSSPEKISGSFVGKLEVVQPNKLSSIVQLTLKDESPRRAQDVLNELLNTYNLASIDDKNAFSQKTLSIVNGKLSNVQRQVDSIQRLVNDYKEKNGIVNLSEQSSLFLQSLGDNDRKIADINRQIAVLDEVENYVNSKANNGGVIPSTLGINDQVLSNLIQKLYDLQINYQRLKVTATENNPTLISLANDIEKTKLDILENTRIQRISLKASRDNLSRTVDSYSSQLKNIPQKEKDLIEISRQLVALNNTYDFLVQKKEEASLSNASTVANSRIIDSAKASSAPTSPQPLIVYLIAVAFAFGVGSFIILCREVFSAKILFRSEINKYTNIPVIAEILNINRKGRRINENEKNTIMHEQFRQLIASMGLYRKNITKKKILVTSSITGEGKSFISNRLASTLASAGKKVVLIDFDFRNPNISKTFDLTEEIGISEFLEGELEPYEIIKRTEQENLFVVPAGTVPLERTNELLLSDKLKDFFSYLEDVCDFIIVDTPPVEPISDAYILSEYCDVSLYVVRHRYTPKTVIRLLDENIYIKTLKNAAIVFNAVKQRGFIKRTYGYGYGFSYQYKKDKSKRA